MKTNYIQRPHAQWAATDPREVCFTGGFWKKRYDRNARVTLPHNLDIIKKPECTHALQNLKIYAGLAQGEYAGTNWQDEFVYKWIEAAVLSWTQSGDESLLKEVDDIVALIAKAQEKDGYIASQFLRHKKRFVKPSNHEFYNMGHLITAACVHFELTGKTNFLEVGRKTGDFIHDCFKDLDERFAHYPYNPSAIMAMVELYRVTGEKKYLDGAAAIVDMRGKYPGGTDDWTDRVPLRQETQVVGHSVFWSYLYSGAADLYLETGEAKLREVLETLWKDLVSKRMYVHGGVAAIHRGFSERPGPNHKYWGADYVHEAVGGAYELPNSTAYNETCSQIGNFMWNWRMFLASSDVKYLEIMELSIYNSIISSEAINGTEWFYTNHLRWYGKDHVLRNCDMLERETAAKNASKDHICCPSNLTRIIAGYHRYLYVAGRDGVAICHYADSQFRGHLTGGDDFHFDVKTDYPWDGKITVTVLNAPDREVSLKFRVPSWCEQAELKVGGEHRKGLTPSGFAEVRKKFTAGEVLTLDLPMGVQFLRANPRIEAAVGQVAIRRGPVLHCLEEVDLPKGVRLSQIEIPRGARFETRTEKGFLDDMPFLEGEVLVVREPDWNGTNYKAYPDEDPTRIRIRLVPYFLHSNRGVGEMSLWLPVR